MRKSGIKVKVLKCKKDKLMWYADKVGEEFDYSYEDDCGVWVRTGDTYNTLNYINHGECIQI